MGGKLGFLVISLIALPSGKTTLQNMSAKINKCKVEAEAGRHPEVEVMLKWTSQTNQGSSMEKEIFFVPYMLLLAQV